MIISVVKTNITLTSYKFAAEQILSWAKMCKSRYVCAANVHMLMEAHDSPKFRQIVNHADLVTPDGMPLVWVIRLKGQRNQQRVYGPTLMLHVLEVAAHENVPVGFYGSSPEVLHALLAKMQNIYPNLKIAYSFSPSFQELTQKENVEIVKCINDSSTRILFVGLGCPKQEIWMAEHKGNINAVMLGVGAAFDFHAGVKLQAPTWMQKIGLEWFFRLITEPGRLWKRYLYNNPRFVFLAAADLLAHFIKSRSKE
jgi:N-acetylglucosaminyldiphosphoundecaprenol N-acetyl-beta-D-mannosaminyltransferase